MMCVKQQLYKDACVHMSAAIRSWVCYSLQHVLTSVSAMVPNITSMNDKTCVLEGCCSCLPDERQEQPS
jgi:hypothetical protein